MVGALAANAANLSHPLLSRDSRAHVLKIWYTHGMLAHGRWDAWCPEWYSGFPYLTFYGSLGYLIGAGVDAVVGDPVASFLVCLVLAAFAVGFGVYWVARSRGFERWVSVICALLALTSGGLMKALNWEGVYPTVLALGFGLLAWGWYERWLRGGDRRRLALSAACLVPALYTHPLGGLLSGGLIFTRGIFEALVDASRREPRFLALSVAPVVVAGLIAFPHYAGAVYYKRFLSELWLYPPGSVAGVVKDLAVGGKWSPGLLVSVLGLSGVVLGLRRRDPVAWFTLFWLVVSVLVCLAYVLGYWSKIPLGRNMLAERYTTVLLPLLLSIAAAPVVRELVRSRWAVVGAVAFLIGLGGVGALSYTPPLPPKLYPSALKAWRWVGGEWGGRSALERVDADPYTHLFDASVPISPIYSGHPTIMGWFSQGDPMFFSLAARWEWELGWVYDPNFVRTSLWATNTRFLVTKSRLVAKRLMREPGFVYRARFGRFRVFEYRGHGGPAAVVPHPIGVVDPWLGLRTENAYYTTLLNFVATPGRRYVFADVTWRGASAFDRLIVRPRRAEDVRRAVELARSGRRVLLILPERCPGPVLRSVERSLGVDLRRSRPPSFVPSRRYLGGAYRVDGRWFRDVRAGGGMVRVCGVDLIRFTMRFHRLIKEVQTKGYRMPRLPTDRERRFVNAVLKGFDSGRPRPAWAAFVGGPERLRVRGSGWVFVKVKYFPAWRSGSGPVLPASCGQMLVRVPGEAELRYEPPAVVSVCPYAAAVAGIAALGALAL